MKTPPSDLSRFESLVEIVATLRAPGGCPWDREQTHQSLTPHALEEAAELVDAIEKADFANMQEELGDCLLQVVLHSEIAEESKRFDISGVIRHLNEKLVRRHPHVFGEDQVHSAAAALENWQKVKADEKRSAPEKPEPMGGPLHLAALTRAYKIGKKTKKAKFDWQNTNEVLAHLETEIKELRDALVQGDKAHIESEIGDLLFCLTQIARHEDVEPESALRRTNLRFEERYRTMRDMVKNRNLDWDKLGTSEKEMLWQEAKKQLRSKKS